MESYKKQFKKAPYIDPETKNTLDVNSKRFKQLVKLYEPQVLNPETDRMIMVGKQTYKNLINKGYTLEDLVTQSYKHAKIEALPDQLLPNDMLNEIINQSDTKELLSLCYSNKNIHQLCKNNHAFNVLMNNLGKAFFTKDACMILTKEGLYVMGWNEYEIYQPFKLTYRLYITTIIPIKNILTVCGTYATFIYYTKEGLFINKFNKIKKIETPPIKNIVCNNYYLFIVTTSNQLLTVSIQSDDYILTNTGLTDVVSVQTSLFNSIIWFKNGIYKLSINPYRVLDFSNLKKYDILGKVLKIVCGFENSIILTDTGLYSINLETDNIQKLNFHETVLDVACGIYHVILLTKSGLYAYGSDNAYGELGQGNTEFNTSHRTIQTAVKIKSKEIVNVYAGLNSTIVKSINNHYYGFGKNIFGIKDKQSITLPTLIYK